MKIQLEASKVRERDLNLLLLEEMYSSSEFRGWVREKLGLPADAKFESGRHMVGTTFGESDIELDFMLGRKVHRVLIEDKIDARFQPDQIVRYFKRADYYVREQDCVWCKTLLFAPRKYAPRKAEGFDAVLPYEELRDWYRKRADGNGRMAWKIALLDAAIKKQHTDSRRSGAQKRPDERANKFWNEFWKFARQEFPDLGMPEPFDKVGGFNYLFPSSLLRRVLLVHSPSKGRVELWFGGVSGKAGVEKIRAMFDGRLDPDMTLRGTSGKVMAGLKAPSINRRGDFNQQAENVKSALEQARRLAKWLEVNGHLWQEHLGLQKA